MLLKLLVAIERFEAVISKATPSELTREFVMCASFVFK